MSLVQKVYSSILTKGLFSSLQNTSVENGKIRVTTDTRQVFLDDGNERKELSSFVKGMTEVEIKELLAPLPKFYLASDTGRILYYDNNDWVVLNAANADYANSSLNSFYATTSGFTEHATSADTATDATNAEFAEESGIAVSLEWGSF